MHLHYVLYRVIELGLFSGCLWLIPKLLDFYRIHYSNNGGGNNFFGYNLFFIIEIIFILLTNNIIRYPIMNYIKSLSLNPIFSLILVILINVVITIFIYKLFNNFFYKYCFVVCFILFIVYTPIALDNFYIVYVNGNTQVFLNRTWKSFGPHEFNAMMKANKLREMIHSLNTAASVCERRGLTGLSDSFRDTSRTLLEDYRVARNDEVFFFWQRYLIANCVGT